MRVTCPPVTEDLTSDLMAQSLSEWEMYSNVQAQAHTRSLLAEHFRGSYVNEFKIQTSLLFLPLVDILQRS